MTQTNPFTEPRFPNIPPFSMMPQEPPVDEESEAEESSPFPDPPVEGDTKEKPGDGH